MAYYFLSYSDNLALEFGGEAKGPFITIRPKYESDVGLHEHEKTHVRQWYAVTGFGWVVCALLALLISPVFWILCSVAPFLHQVFYRYVRPYRRWCEVQAYQQQIANGDYANSDFAVSALVEKYDLGLDSQEAKALLAD